MIERSPLPETERALVVDLDFSLIKTDLLWEALNQVIARRPYLIIQAIFWLFGSRAKLKEKLSHEIAIDPVALPLNAEVMALIHEARAAGRPVVLATASPKSWADAVAAELGVFDRVFASADGVNLRASAKRQVLIAEYGEGGFDYVGDSSADLLVWQSAEAAYPVTSSARFVDRVRNIANVPRALSPNRDYGVVTAIWASLRAHQWVKNLLVFLPLITSHSYGQPAAVLSAVLAFFAFSFTASAAYIINDLVDVWNDRHHQRKRNRPIASGNLNIVVAWGLWVLLALLAAGFAILLPLSFVLVLVSYFALTLAYSFYLKQKPIADGLFLGLLYTLRVLAGTAAIMVPLSYWMLTFAIFFFMSLALLKRYSELLTLPDLDEQQELRGRGYRRSDLPLVQMIGVASGIASTLIIALFVHDERAVEHYATPELLWAIVPLLIFWVCRAWLKGHRGIMLEDPVVWALKDYASWIMIALFGLSFMGARWLELGWLVS